MARKVERQAAYGCPSKGSSRGQEYWLCTAGVGELVILHEWHVIIIPLAGETWSWSLGYQGSIGAGAWGIKAAPNQWVFVCAFLMSIS